MKEDLLLIGSETCNFGYKVNYLLAFEHSKSEN